MSGQLSETTGRRGQPPRPGFLAPFGRRHSLLGHPIPAKELGLPHGRLTGSEEPDPDGVTAFRTHELRPGWVPPIPRGQWCSPGRVASPTGTRRFPAAVPLPRHDIPPCEAPLHEASTGVQSRSPVRSSPRPRLRGGTGDASAFPRASHPTVTGSARQGRGQAIEHGPGTTLTTSAEPPFLRVHSMRATSRRTAICETRPAPRAETCLHVPAGTTAGQPCDPCCTEAATYRRQSRIASRLLRARSGKDGRHGPERRVGDVCGDHLRRGIPGSSRPNTRARGLRLLLEEDPADPPPPRGGPPGRRGVP